MKIKFFLLIITLFVFFFQSVGLVEARSGCCSHHGGVCGCGCCDGSSLSAKCAPYYPQCSGGDSEQEIIEDYPTIVVPTRVVPTRVIPTKLPTRIPTAVPKCSHVADSYCPVKGCGPGRDPDCCSAQKNGYQWYEGWGCYPSKLSCSGVSDNKCDKYCGAGNDADCCNNQNNGYLWYENWGCYPKQ